MHRITAFWKVTDAVGVAQRLPLVWGRALHPTTNDPARHSAYLPGPSRPALLSCMRLTCGPAAWVSAVMTATLLGCGGPAEPEVEVFEFRDGVSPTAAYEGTWDAILSESEPAKNFGTTRILEVDGDSPNTTGLDMWSVLFFDLSPIPPGKQVDSVELVVHIVKPSRESADIFALARPWEHGEVNWRFASTYHPWGAPGAGGPGDRADPVMAQFIAAATGELTITFNAAGVAQTQSWLDEPLKNYGFIVVQPLATDGVDFYSSEAEVERRPLLRVAVRDPAAVEDSSLYVLGCAQATSPSSGLWPVLTTVGAIAVMRRRRTAQSRARRPIPHKT